MGSSEHRIIVGIESAIEGGSLVLYRDGVEIDGLIGEKGISRAEDILPNLDQLLLRNGLRREEIGKVVVATGPGSFTGIKIGISTALGLADGLDCPAVGISSLEALTYAVQTDGDVFTAVPVGRDFVATQHFKKNGDVAIPFSDPKLLTETPFTQLLNIAQGVAVLYSGLIGRLDSVSHPKVIDAGANIASLVVKGDLFGASRKNIVPLFIDRKPIATAG